MQSQTQAERPEMPWITVWTEEEIRKLQLEAVNASLKCDSQPSVETTMEFAKYLRSTGLTSDNYPLFLARGETKIKSSSKKSQAA